MITLEEIRSTAPMRALSWKQPYLGLMFHDKIETRTWPTDYRGLVLMCASKQPYPPEVIMNISGDIQYRRIMKLMHQEQGMWFMNFGNALAVGRLVDCYPMPVEDEYRWPAPPGREQYPWEAPRLVAGMDCTINGYNFREDLLRMLGNAVVYQTAAKAYIDLLSKFR